MNTFLLCQLDKFLSFLISSSYWEVLSLLRWKVYRTYFTISKPESKLFPRIFSIYSDVCKAVFHIKYSRHGNLKETQNTVEIRIYQALKRLCICNPRSNYHTLSTCCNYVQSLKDKCGLTSIEALHLIRINPEIHEKHMQVSRFCDCFSLMRWRHVNVVRRWRYNAAALLKVRWWQHVDCSSISVSISSLSMDQFPILSICAYVFVFI